MAGSYPLTKLFVFGLLLCIAIPVQNYAQQNTYNDDETREVIVKFANHATQTQKREISEQVKAVLIKRFENTDTELWRIPLIVEINGETHKGLNTISDYVKGHPGIQYIEPNHSIAIFNAPNDPFFNRLWGLHNTGQLAGLSGADIGILQAWEITIGSGSTTVGILDTGIDWTHEDLAENIWQNLEEDADGDGHVIEWNGSQWVMDEGDLNGVDDDGNGYVDDIIGWDFVNNDNNPYDDNGHGTHVSGTIGARGNNDTGISGVAQQVALMPLKIFDGSGVGNIATAKEAMEYALNNGADITNISWGTTQDSETMYEAFEDAQNNDQLVVAAVGNNNRDNDIVPVYPASYDFENIVAVAAVNRHNSLTIFSNYGETSVDIGAPGGDIFSTLPGNFYGWYSGTSMATPHVTGALALALSACNSTTPAEIKNHLLNTATPLNTPNNRGVNVLNVHKFLQEATRPNAEFIYTTDGLEVEFTAENEQDDFTYDWNFGDNTSQSLSENEAEYEYSESDHYTVCLIVSNACGSSTSCQNVFVNVDNIQPDCVPEWQQFTSGDNVLAVAEQGDYIWAGGKGGLAKINRIDGTNTFFTNNNSGLPHNHINSITVDANGTKWIGTKGGLVKFDGTNWVTYDTQNSGLPSNDVQSVAITPVGGLRIIATNGGGVALFNGESNWIILDTGNAMLLSDEIIDVAVDNQSIIFAATPNGVMKLGTSGFIDLEIGNIAPDFDIVNDIAIEPVSGNLWAATKGGVAFYNGTTWETINTGLAGESISIDVDAEGSQWVGTNSGAYRLLNDNTWEPQYDGLGTESGQEINAVLITNNEVWLGTNRSIKKFAAGQWSVFNQLNSPLSANNIRTFVEDNNGSMWIGTSDGLVQLAEDEWIQHPEFTNEAINALYFNDGKLWIGTDLRIGEIDIDDDIANVTFYSSLNDKITSITADQDGQIWAGTQAAGIAALDDGDWTIYNTGNSSLPDNNIRTIVADATTGLWIATANGVANLGESGWTTYSSPTADNVVTGLATDTDGVVWLTTANNLARIDATNTWSIENVADSPKGIQGLLIDGYNSKWLSTEEGFCKYDGYSCTIYNVANSPLANDNVQVIQQDGGGSYWIGTEGGVSVLSALTASFTYDNQLPCNNTIVPMRNSSTGALEQNWYINDVYVSSDKDYTYDFVEPGTYEVKLITTNNENCTATFIEEITIGDLAEDINLQPAINVCDDIALLEANLENMQNYRWYRGEEMLSNARQFTAIESGDYTLEVQDWCDNWSTTAISVTLSARCIWPGDTDDNGIVNAVDVLPIGQALGSTGPIRIDSGEWEGQANPDWPIENLAYADANGDGIVDSMDLETVFANYGQTHGEAGLGLSSVISPGSGFGGSGYVADTPPDAYLCLVPDENSLFNGEDDILFNVELTEKPGITFESYGIAYTIKHDGQIDNTDFSSAWLKGNGTLEELLIFEQDAPGRLDIAQSRGDQNNIGGDGGVSEIIVLEDFPSGELASLEHTAIYSVENITLTDKDGIIIPVEGHTLVISHPGSEGEIAPIALSIKGRAATCYGEGSAEITVHRGTAPFTYEWDNGETTPAATSLSPGIHYLTVTDAGGEVITGMAYIEDHTGIYLDYEVTAETDGSENGSITLTPSGSSNFTYEWSSGQTSASVAGLQAGTYTVTITNDEGCQKVETIVVSGRLCVKPKFVLEGAFDPATGLMRADLQANGFLPLVSPYETGESVSVNAFTALETNDVIVDWVVVELRDKNSIKLIARQTALLQRDGDVISLDGTDGVKFDNLPEDNYYITVRHRNHFSLVSATTPFLGREPVIEDFTLLPNLTRPGAELPEVAPGVYAAHGGNSAIGVLENEEDITGEDRAIWGVNNGSFNLYDNNDFTLDRDINGADLIIWQENNGKFNELPD